MAVPGEITGLAHTSATDSLDFTWDAQAAADGYQLSLARDGVEVASQAVATAEATFSGLEDGTDYTLTIYAYNAEGDGPASTYQATTAYMAPAAPTNLRQFEERIIAVICRWDLVEPDKTHDVQLQLLYGDDLLYDEVRDADLTERTFPVPMASTNYLLRVRAGNPGGWSEWAEAWVYTENFPLIDSRLAVLAAGYQEDALYPDTWDGGADASGLGDQQSVEGAAELKFLNPMLLDGSPESMAMNAAIEVGEFETRPVNLYYTDPDNVEAMSVSIGVGDFETRPVNLYYTDPDNEDALSVSVSVGDFDTVQVLYRYTDPDNNDAMSASVIVGDFTTEIA